MKCENTEYSGPVLSLLNSAGIFIFNFQGIISFSISFFDFNRSPDSGPRGFDGEELLEALSDRHVPRGLEDLPTSGGDPTLK
jgi:hypothetical protein